MYGIICKKDGNASISIPIVKDSDDGVMATWDTLEEAQEFSRDNILCQMSAVIIIDLDNETIE